jgi:predicted permease
MRVRAIARRQQRERELAAELESHLQLHIDDNIRSGMSPADARRQAMLALGGVEQTKERVRDRLGFPSLESFVQDLRFGARVLRRHPAVTAVAVLTLAVGFGPPIAIFALASDLVLRPIAGIDDSSDVSYFMTGSAIEGGVRVGRVSYLNLRDLTRRLRTTRLAAAQTFAGATVEGNGRPARLVNGQFVSGDYFDVLGVRMQAGRPLTAMDDDPSNPQLVAVIGDDLWASLFDRNPAAIGQTMSVNGHRVTIVAVADREFQGPFRFQQHAFWMPGVTELLLRALEGRPDDRARGGYYQFFARLAPGMTWAQVDAELTAATAWLREQYPDANAKFATIGFHNQGPIDTFGLDRYVALLAVMFGAAVLVLLIASANVATLVLMRSLARRGEVALRRTLGAGRWRVVRQHITETLLLWLLGAAVGVLLVWALVNADVASRLTEFGIPASPASIDWRVMAFTGGLALSVGLLFSVLPAWKGTTVDPAPTVQAMAATATPRLRAAPVLVAGQLSASLPLLVGALMLALTLRNLMAVDIGFDPSNITVFRASVAPGASESAAYVYLDEFRRRVSARPGVEAAAMASGAPFAGAGNAILQVRAGTAAEYVDVPMHEVLSPEYFDTLGIRLLRGRQFSPEEFPLPGRDRVHAVILSAALATRLFGTLDVVGRIVEQPVSGQPPRISTIVGVADDVRLSSLTEPMPPVLYTAGGLFGFRLGATLIVKTTPGVAIDGDIRSVARSLGSPPPTGITTLDDALTRARGEWDLLARLMAALAAVASIIAAVGVYGVVAFSAASRRAEFGIRMALGATAAIVRRHVLRGVAMTAAAGMTAGLAGAYAVMQALRARLVGVGPLDPAVWGAAALLLLSLVIFAAVLPAYRAARVSLGQTLRAL